MNYTTTYVFLAIAAGLLVVMLALLVAAFATRKQPRSEKESNGWLMGALGVMWLAMFAGMAASANADGTGVTRRAAHEIIERNPGVVIRDLSVDHHFVVFKSGADTCSGPLLKWHDHFYVVHEFVTCTTRVKGSA